MANDFSADSTCIALYRFENGALTTDSKGSETLTQNGGAADTSVFKEGAASVLLNAASNNYFYRTDANLGASFPLKSGTSNLTISLASWFRMVTAPSGSNFKLGGKSDTGGGHRSWFVMIEDQAGTYKVILDLGKTDGTFSEQLTHATGVVATTWYHLTAIYRDSDKLIALRLRDTAGAVIGSDATGTAVNHLAAWSQTDFVLGAIGSGASPESPFFNGYLDEMVVFSKALTATDSTNIAKGLYSGTGDPGTVTSPMFRGT